MRAPVQGGPPQKVADGTYYPFALCARSPGRVCVLLEQDGRQLNVYALDPQGGRGPRVASTEVTEDVVVSHTALSPDGSRLAIGLSEAGRIRMLSMQGGRQSDDLTVTGWKLDPVTLYWAADGSGLYAPSTSTTRTPPGTDLLFVDVNGCSRVVWHQGVSDWGTGIPSPDGRHLAITQGSTLSNVWMLEGS